MKSGRLAEDFVAFQEKIVVLQKISQSCRVSDRLSEFLAVLQVGKPPCRKLTCLSAGFRRFSEKMY